MSSLPSQWKIWRAKNEAVGYPASGRGGIRELEIAALVHFVADSKALWVFGGSESLSTVGEQVYV